MAIKVKIVSFVSSFSPSECASIPSPAFAGVQCDCTPHNVFIDSFLKGMEKKTHILFLSLWVCKYPLPCFCWPTPPIKSHLSKKPPLTLSACLHSLPVFSVYSYWFPPTHSLSPFSRFCTISLRQMKRGWVEKAWVGEACKSKKGKEVSNNGKKGCTAAKIEKEPSRGRKGWESSSLRGGGWKREDMTGLFPESCKQLFICYKSRPGGGGRQINTTFKILLQEIYFFRQCNGDCQCLAARLISLQSHLIFWLICDSSKSSVFCHPRSHRAPLDVRAPHCFIFSDKNIYKQESVRPQEVHLRREENDN